MWDDPTKAPDLLALAAGVVVRDQYPERFLDAHVALFAARHDEGLDLRVPEVVARVLDGAGRAGRRGGGRGRCGRPGAGAAPGPPSRRWPSGRCSVCRTFVLDDRAVFVRLMSRPQGDGVLARRTVQGVLDLFDSQPDLNEFKYTTLSR